MRWVIAIARGLLACGVIDLVLLVATLSLMACSAANRRSDIIIPPQCLTKDLHMIDCDTSVDPPRCKKFTIEYIGQCAQIKLTGK